MTEDLDDNKLGRPTLYKKEYDNQVYELALLGLTDVQISNVLGITKQTLNNWKHDHQTFFDSLTHGKEYADGKVAKAMYNRAIGIVITEEAVTKDGDVVQLKKEIPSDTSAAKHWLSNRQRNLWANNGETTIKSTEPLIIIRTEGDNDE
jgi:hypothetical protein